MDVRKGLTWPGGLLIIREKQSKFTGSLNFKSGLNYIWNTCKILKDKWVKASLGRGSGSPQVNGLVESALDSLCPPFVISDPSWLPPGHEDQFLDSPFNFVEFNTALESKNESSACGMDGVDYFVLKALPIRYKLLLLDIFNEMYLTGLFPPDWKKSFTSLVNQTGLASDLLASSVARASYLKR